MVDPVTPVEQPTAQQPITPEALTPQEDFIKAYNALCAEKGYELTFKITHSLKADNSFDLTSAIVDVSVSRRSPITVKA